MANNFFTLGLPRSRSTWLTELLRTRYADCYHEKLSAFGWDTLPYSDNQYVGSCDTNPLNKTPREPLVIVERPVDEVVESMLAAFDNPFDKPFRPFVTGLIHKYKIALDEFKGLRISVTDLDDYHNLESIVRYLKPEETIDEYHIRIVMETRVTVKSRDLLPGIDHMALHGYNTDLNGLYNIIAGD